jgi:hypothetical protein
LREPLETGVVAVSRVAMRAEYPAEFQLVAAMNPCPCGYQGDPSERCECTPGRIAQYRARVSGPLLDRIDLRVEVPALAQHELKADLPVGDSSAQAASKVALARERQLRRAGKLNSRLTIHDINVHCRLDEAADRVFWQSQACLGLSARSYHHTLRVARTIADLDKSDTIRDWHVAEALQLKRAFGYRTNSYRPCGGPVRALRAGHTARSAVATGSRAARTAGNSAPTSPIRNAQITPTAMSPGVSVSAKTICATPPPLVLTRCPSKNSHAASEPIAAPMSARATASTNTEITTGVAPKPSARNVAISFPRVLTAVYIVLSAPNSAPTAMMPPTTYAMTDSIAVSVFD